MIKEQSLHSEGSFAFFCGFFCIVFKKDYFLMYNSFNIKKIFTPFIFFLAFVLPIFIFYFVIKYYNEPKEIVKEVKYEKNTFSVKLPGESLRVFDKNILNPEQGKDFILTSWFKFRKLPQDGERAILITKYDATSAYKQGYGFAIEKNSSTGYRGSVFWQDINNNGRWYTFGEIPLVTNKWFMFTISYTSNKHLALHYTYELDNEVITKLSGAYKVTAMPASQSSFRIGSLVSQIFDGRIGTVSILKLNNTENDLENIINENFNNPQTIPDMYKKDEVEFWSIGGSDDISKNALKVIKVGKTKNKSKNKEENID